MNKIRTRKVILLGREQKNLDKGLESITVSEVECITCTSLESLADALQDQGVDTAILGAGLSINVRLEAIRMIYEASDKISVHMKERVSGPEGFGPFANRVLQTE